VGKLKERVHKFLFAILTHAIIGVIRVIQFYRIVALLLTCAPGLKKQEVPETTKSR
jgi:hypothetical protein